MRTVQAGTVQAMTRSAATNDGVKQRIADFMTGFEAYLGHRGLYFTWREY